MRSAAVAFILVLLVASAGVGFAMLFLVMAPVGLYDYNFDTFERVLTRDQGNAIIRTAESQLSSIVIILTVTNVLWLALGIYLLRRIHGLTRSVVRASSQG